MEDIILKEDKIRLEKLKEEYEATSRQISEIIDLSQITVLKRKLERIKNEIIELENSIQIREKQNQQFGSESNEKRLDLESSLEKMKSNLLELIDENEYDEIFNILSNSKDIKYDKSVCNQFKAEFTQGQSKYDTNYAKRLRAFVNGLKKIQGTI